MPDAVQAGGRIGYSLTVDGRRVGTSTVFVGTGGGGGSRQRVEPGTVTSMRFETPLERVSAAGLALSARGVTLYLPGRRAGWFR